MSSLQNFLKENPDFNKTTATKTNNFGERLNLPVKIMSYDPPYFVGQRLDTKEDVRVVLDEIEKNPNSNYSRPEIKDFMGPRNKVHAVPGEGVIVFENAFEKDGVFHARWATTLSATESETQVMISEAKIVFGENDNKSWVVAHLLMTDYAKKVSSREELDQNMTKFLKAKTNGSRPYVVIRISDGSMMQTVNVFPSRATVKVTNSDGSVGERTVVAEPEVSIADFYASDNSKIVLSLLGSSDIVMEVIPCTQIYAGTSTKEKLFSESNSLRNIITKSYEVEEVLGDKKVLRPGYLKTIIATRRYDDNTPYMSARPFSLTNFDKAHKLSEVDTKNIQGIKEVENQTD